jgi:anti-anti-sigma regulatory factor
LLELPASVTIHGIRALHAEIQAQLRPGASPRRLVVDGSKVEEIDTAGLQLLLAARRSADAAGAGIEWRSLPVVLLRAAQSLALTDALGLREGE